MPVPVLTSLTAQADRLVGLGLVADPGALRDAAERLERDVPVGSLLVVHERLMPASVLAPHLRLPAPGRAGAAGEVREGFVVVDMTDVDEFRPTAHAELPDADVYAVIAPRRGDEMRNWSPEEALPALVAAGRAPLTLVEAIHWALQVPEVIEANACFMTVGSRKIKADGTFDSRTPALWISSGTGRDGRERKGAPKVGWCWWGNRHTWLGFASAEGRAGA